MIAAYLSLKAAAEYASLSIAGLYRAMESGSLPFHKVGGRRLIKRADLESFIEGRLPDCEVAA